MWCHVFGELVIFGIQVVDFTVQVRKAYVMQSFTRGDLPMVCPILECFTINC